MEVEVGASRGMEGRRGLRRLRRPAQEGTAVGVEVEELVVVVVMEGVERLRVLSGRVRVNRSLYHDRGPVKMVEMRRRRVEVEAAARRMLVLLRKRMPRWSCSR